MFSKFRLCKQQLQFYCIQCQDFHFSFWLEIFFWERGGEKEKIYGDILDLVFVIFLRWEKSQMFLKAHFWLFNGYAMFLQKANFSTFFIRCEKNLKKLLCDFTNNIPTFLCIIQWNSAICRNPKNILHFLSCCTPYIKT